MSLQLYLLFVLASALLIVTPGPNVALVVGTSLRYGARTGLLTVGGVNFGLLLQLSAVAAGLSWIVDLFARHFDLIRYIGAAYLALLGLQQLFARPKATAATTPVLRGEHAFARGFAVAFANPKTLIFQAAFLPQFLGPGQNLSDLWLLAATFAVIAALGDGLYALFAARARAAVTARARRIADKTSGAILLGGAAVLLAARR
ncbi:MAG TPA: LysE family translocator [Xanthobacteraceae bacterium]|nr:LysE family translocator [Xanthobacteraceae bacterium]